MEFVLLSLCLAVCRFALLQSRNMKNEGGRRREMDDPVLLAFRISGNGKGGWSMHFRECFRGWKD